NPQAIRINFPPRISRLYPRSRARPRRLKRGVYLRVFPPAAAPAGTGTASLSIRVYGPRFSFARFFDDRSRKATKGTSLGLRRRRRYFCRNGGVETRYPVKLISPTPPLVVRDFGPRI